MTPRKVFTTMDTTDTDTLNCRTSCSEKDDILYSEPTGPATVAARPKPVHCKHGYKPLHYTVFIQSSTVVRQLGITVLLGSRKVIGSKILMILIFPRVNFDNRYRSREFFKVGSEWARVKDDPFLSNAVATVSMGGLHSYMGGVWRASCDLEKGGGGLDDITLKMTSMLF